MTTDLVLLGTAGAPMPVTGRPGIASALVVGDRVCHQLRSRMTLVLAMNAPSTNQEIDMSDISRDPRLTDAPAPVYGPSRTGDAIVGDAARAVFGQVMGPVALTVRCALCE